MIYNYDDNLEGKGIKVDDVLAICEEVHLIPEIGRFHKHPKPPHDTTSNKKLKLHFKAMIGDKKEDRMVHKQQILKFVHESPEYSAFDFIQHMEESCGGKSYWKKLFEKRNKQTKFCGNKIARHELFDYHVLIKRLDNVSKEILHGPKEAITRNSMNKRRRSALGTNKRGQKIKKIGGKHADVFAKYQKGHAKQVEKKKKEDHRSGSSKNKKKHHHQGDHSSLHDKSKYAVKHH